MPDDHLPAVVGLRMFIVSGTATVVLATDIAEAIELSGTANLQEVGANGSEAVLIGA